MRSTAPALNCPQELYSLVHTLDEESFPDWKEYAERYCDRKLIFVAGGRRSWDTRGASNLPELHKKLSTLMVRRRKTDVLTQLPAKTRRTVKFVFKMMNSAFKMMSFVFENDELCMKRWWCGWRRQMQRTSASYGRR